LLLCTVAFAAGLDTPDIFNNGAPIFYLYHTFTWHILLVMLFVYFVVFRFEGSMNAKLNRQLFIFIFLFNLFIFFYMEIFRSADIRVASVQWILYNHDIQPIFDWCHQDPYLTNFVVFIATTCLYEGVYFAYFYIERAIRRNWYKKHKLKINF
jgi:hypothetical protein